MDSSHNGHRSPYRCKDCDFSCEDADKIQVTISPRRFTLPPPSERRKTMEIENKNSYPIYFKAGTSNMGAFRPQPNMGKIPPNGKISVTVQFFDSAMPIRRHEEVVVIASIKPFEQYSNLSSDNICPFCYESVQQSKYHQTRRLEDDNYFDERRFSQNTALDEQLSKELQFDKYQNNSAPSKGETQSKHNSIKEIDEPKKEMLFSRKFSAPNEDLQSSEYHSKKMDKSVEMPKSSGEQLMTERDENVKTRCTNGLEEICLHAFIHRPTNGSCNCGNCGELGVLPTGDIQIKSLLSKIVKDHKATEPMLLKHAAEEQYTDIRKDDTVRRGKKDLEKELREKRKEAHILARIIKARDAKDMSDTEISEMSSKDMKLGKIRPTFISEEDFQKKMQKAKFKRRQKRLKEESLSTTTTDVTIAKEPEKSPRKKDALISAVRKNSQFILGSIDSKCTTILQLTWTTFFFLILLLMALGVFTTYYVLAVTSSNENDLSYPRLPCFYDLFR